MATINFYIRPELKDSRGFLPIYLVYQHKGRKFKHYTGHKVVQEHWSTETQQVMPGFPDAIRINSFLSQQREKLQQISIQSVSNDSVNLQAIKNTFINKKAEEETQFFKSFREFINHSSESKKRTTILIYETLLKDLQRFDELYSYNLSFPNINTHFYELFTCFLGETLNNTNNTISKKIKTLKAFLNVAATKKLIDYSAYHPFKTRMSSSLKISLTESELSRIFNLNLSIKKELGEARDLFLFGCFTGLKFSDIVSLNPQDIVNDRISIYNPYSKRNINIPLNNYAMMLVKKYEGRYKTSFPVISNALINKYVKELALMARIDAPTETEVYRGKDVIKRVRPKYELITADTARFTYATLSLKAGMRPELLMVILGQKNIHALLQYVIDNNPMKDIEMVNCWNKKVF
jgi:integrase